MGKAGKWILNFLVGKKEENQKKKKKKICSSSLSDHSENLKLKWSFRKTSTKTTNLLLTHNLSKSVNSIDTIEAMKHLAIAEQKKPPSTVQNAAATTIQSAYRSHLARKALHALRALVKIQALVRGHLVRKQTAATLKSLQALMAIQVRARATRIQLLEEDEELLERRRRKHLIDNLKQAYKERLNMNVNEDLRPYKTKSGHISHSQIEQLENEPNAYCRRNLSIPRRQHQHKNHSVSIEPDTSEYYILVSKPTAETALYSMDQPRHSDFVPDDYLFYPNYMAKTESSRAKVRSQSEPKQRPCPTPNSRMKSKQIGTADRMSLNDQIQSSLQSLKHNGYENHNNPWFMKLYQFKKPSKNRDGDSTSSRFSFPDDPP
ncbi:uncharacterized protein LOC120080123 [Benincasa hispida]|uniref:uncharacterized protein LOC120080123 n=1 Tax=Benincasa hispida TaxID=102211 RepID=UPI0018FF9D63|nr:uncharacterized protein LOC120080123 [Benincasa hispida]